MLQSREICELIESMTLTLRAFTGPAAPHPPHRPRMWWVLVMGASYNPLDYGQRMEAREGLRAQAAAKGFVPEEYVWVWDDSNRAQLVAGRYAKLSEAREMSDALSALGLTPRLIEARVE